VFQRPFLAVTAFLLAVVVATLTFFALDRNHRASDLEGRVEAHAKVLQASARSRTSSEAGAEDTRRKLGLARHFAWEAVFNSIEEVVSSDIEMLTVNPNKSTSSVSIRANAQSYDAMLRFVQSLEKRAGFDRVHIASFERKVVGALNLLEFEVVAQLPPPPKSEAARTVR
jgi:hypothetical protein